MKLPSLVLVIVSSLAISANAQSPKTEEPAAAAKVQDVTPDEVEKLAKEKPGLVILDVRTKDEFDAGHLAGAVNDSFLDDDFAEKLAAVEGRPVVLHCGSGGRSSRALEILKKHKFSQIYHMKGGYKAWIAAGKPVAGKTEKTK